MTLVQGYGISLSAHEGTEALRSMWVGWRHRRILRRPTTESIIGKKRAELEEAVQWRESTRMPSARIVFKANVSALSQAVAISKAGA